MKRTVKVQKTRSNTFINLPVVMAELMGFEKGTKVDIEMKGKKIVMTLSKEEK